MSDWNINFIKQYWRYLHFGEVSVDHQNWIAGIPLKRRIAGTLLPIITIYLVMWLWQILIPQILIHSDVQMSRYFSKSHDPIMLMLQALGEECHLDFSQKLYLSNFGYHRPSRSEDSVNFTLIVTVQRYSEPLLLTIAYFLLPLKKCSVYSYCQ